MNYKLLVDTAVLAGEIMLRSGAETYRVEDTIYRILKTSGFDRCDVFVVSTGIIVTLADSSIDAISQVRRVAERQTDLGNIYYANDISRKLCSGEIDLETANEKLNELTKVVRYPTWLAYLCMIIAAPGFAILLGANFIECFLAMWNGIFIMVSNIMSKRLKINRFVTNMMICAVMAISSTCIVNLFHLNAEMELIIAGAIMPLLPGVALTNGIRDTLQGDYVSGAARLVEAFVTAASLAVGIGAGLALAKVMLGGIV
ncbi:threonine/serine exporter family protein [Lachnoclostridium sp.]|uniref:threonine/serine exporter family protein n=1 Tax=Lachnoclostridium sp. TaxID=2028282 RepID=UPI00289C003E|nr:threonine/serine exporter family protein [Lachnoclostridium sp.]